MLSFYLSGRNLFLGGAAVRTCQDYDVFNDHLDVCGLTGDFVHGITEYIGRNDYSTIWIPEDGLCRCRFDGAG